MRGFIVHSQQPRLPARSVGDVMQTPPMAPDAHSPAGAARRDLVIRAASSWTPWKTATTPPPSLSATVLTAGPGDG